LCDLTAEHYDAKNVQSTITAVRLFSRCVEKALKGEKSKYLRTAASSGLSSIPCHIDPQSREPVAEITGNGCAMLQKIFGGDAAQITSFQFKNGVSLELVNPRFSSICSLNFKWGGKTKPP
jgi:hypothetical protein